MIPKISAEDLKKMQDREGLVLQGCGGDLQEWEDGIHQMLAEEKILQNGAHFKEIYAFEHEGCTNLLFMMDGIELDTGRLALWRLRTHTSPVFVTTHGIGNYCTWNYTGVNQTWYMADGPSKQK